VPQRRSRTALGPRLDNTSVGQYLQDDGIRLPIRTFGGVTIGQWRNHSVDCRSARARRPLPFGRLLTRAVSAYLWVAAAPDDRPTAPYFPTCALTRYLRMTPTQIKDGPWGDDETARASACGWAPR
jgi:hypothetical protein